MEERFKKQFTIHYNKLTKQNIGVDEFLNKMKKKVGFLEKYNPAALACAAYYNVNKDKKSMDICVEFLAEQSQLDPKASRQEIMMDILRYVKVINQ